MTGIVWRKPGATKKKPKYGNSKATLNGEKFDSRAELARYQVLLKLQHAGGISQLTRQVSFVLAPKAVVGGKLKRSLIYRADFQYCDHATGRMVVEDVKGMLTEAYKIKRHLMKTLHGIDIVETK
jgi:hypothetical protein